MNCKIKPSYFLIILTITISLLVSCDLIPHPRNEHACEIEFGNYDFVNQCVTDSYSSSSFSKELAMIGQYCAENNLTFGVSEEMIINGKHVWWLIIGGS